MKRECRSCLYRYEDRVYASMLDEDDRTIPGTTKIDLREFPIIKWTPKGAWIDVGLGVGHREDQKFVLLTARKRYACLTLEEAMESFKYRKKRQIKKLNAQLRQAEKALALSERE